MKRIWQVTRWVLVGLVLMLVIRRGVGILRNVPGAHNVPFDAWYGNWTAALTATAVFLVFVLGFAWPRRRREWRNAGLYSAFLISLFTEMFGIPLTIYLLAPLLGLPPWAFGMNESHLWAFVMDRLGLLPLHLGVYTVMTVSLVLIASGTVLVAVGWATVYRGREALVTGGIYRHLRHPQYLGLILIVIGFIVMWPTLPTLVMAPILTVVYRRLARREDEELATRFGDAFLDYSARTPAFVPWGAIGLLRVGAAGLVIVLSSALVVLVARHLPSSGAMGLPFEEWYGNWRAVLVATGLFTAFLLAFARPRRNVEWRNTGLYVAFLLSLFAEMFGLPLTIFLISPFLGVSPFEFGNHESHLWAYLLDRAGVLPLEVGVYVVMVVSVALIALGASLVAIGWVTVYRGRDTLVTGGIYRYLRHPQYLGLVLIILAFNIQWPTLPTLLMAPILIGMYVRVARREDQELAMRFGEAFREYAARTPALIPWGRRGEVRDLPVQPLEPEERPGS